MNQAPETENLSLNSPLLSNRIRRLREDKDIGLRQMARRVGMDSAQLSRLERGLGGCSMDMAMAIAHYLEEPVEVVFSNELAETQS